MLLINLFLEVLDKEPAAQSFWLAGSVFALAGFVICRWRWELILVVAPVWLIFGWFVTSEFFDSAIGAAIWAESHGYVYQLFGSVAVAAVGPAVGALLRYKKGPPGTPRLP